MSVQRTNIVSVLRSYAHSQKEPKYAVYIDGKPVYFYNGKNIFKSIGIAKRKILENSTLGISATDKAYQKYRDELDTLIEEGIIQIKPII